jgi:hypothetical protein
VTTVDGNCNAGAVKVVYSALELKVSSPLEFSVLTGTDDVVWCTSLLSQNLLPADGYNGVYNSGDPARACALSPPSSLNDDSYVLSTM